MVRAAPLPILVGVVVLWGASAWAQSRFREALGDSGIDFVTVSGEPDKRHISSTLGSGVALVDYDQDGDLDVYLVNGARVSGGEVNVSPADRLFENEGGWRFVDVTERAGIRHPGWGVGISAGDIDDDGFPDLYVTRIGDNLLYRNRGDGTFDEISDAAGLADPGWGTSSVFFDADRDGDLDLYVANYLELDWTALPPPGQESRCQWFGISIMCGPKGLDGQSDVFFVNQGDGTFADRTEASGLWDPSGAYGLGVVAGDIDGDGDQDLYVANDSVPNFLYVNDGAGRFAETAFLSGVALSNEGLAQAGMGVDWGDLNGDGALDVFVTNFSHETNNAYLNHGGGMFLDAVGEANLHGPSWFSLGWGVRLVDFDHDGDLDVFVANGHVYPGVDDTNLKTRYRQPNQVFWNDGAGVFSESAGADGDALARVAASRAAAFGDLDGDGDVDGIVVNIDESPSLLDNLVGDGGHWARVRLVGTRSPRDGAGASVTISLPDGRAQHRFVHSSGSFLSASEPELHFGLGTSSSTGPIEVRWSSGHVETLGAVSAGRRAVIVEGRGIVVP